MHVSQGPSCIDTSEDVSPDSEDPSLSESFNEKYNSDSAEEDGEDISPSSSSPGVEWEVEEETGEEDETGNWRKLNPEDPYEKKLIDQGHTEINLDAEQVR